MSALHNSRADPAPSCTCQCQPTVLSKVVAKSQRGLQRSWWWALSVTRLSRLASWGPGDRYDLASFRANGVGPPPPATHAAVDLQLGAEVEAIGQGGIVAQALRQQQVAAQRFQHVLPGAGRRRARCHHTGASSNRDGSSGSATASAAPAVKAARGEPAPRRTMWPLP